MPRSSAVSSSVALQTAVSNAMIQSSVRPKDVSIANPNSMISKGGLTGGAPLTNSNKHSTSALIDAVFGDNVKGVKSALDEGAAVNTPACGGETVLHVACRTGRRKIVEALLKARDIKVNQVDSHGNTPLHLVLRRDMCSSLTRNMCSRDYTDHFKCARLLLKHKNIDVKSAYPCGSTLLHNAIHLKAPRDIIEELLIVGSDIDAKDGDGNSPIAIAIMTQSSDIYSLLKNIKLT